MGYWQEEIKKISLSRTYWSIEMLTVGGVWVKCRARDGTFYKFISEDAAKEEMVEVYGDASWDGVIRVVRE